MRNYSGPDRHRGIERGPAEFGADPQREGGIEGARQKADPRATESNSQKGCRGKVALMPAALRPFKADREKILESVVYLINQRNDLSQWDILKAIFIADKYHLNKYGRPVTFDNYVAMELGPVGSLTYDILKPTAKWHNYYKEERPWVTLPRGKQNIFVEVKRQHKKDVLSETDVAALNSGLDMVLTLSFTQLKRLTHDDPAYKEAWKRRGIAKAADMDMQRLLDEQDDETIERLAYVTRS